MKSIFLKFHYVLPPVVWSDEGPVAFVGVEPLCIFQSNTSVSS